LKVYNSDFWWSDNWNPIDYGRDFDFSKNFFEQFEKLIKKVPLVPLFITDSENSDYTNLSSNNKSCYMLT
jgi:hypothetical protein